MHILIGIDDTDIAGSPGTGKLARALCSELERCGAIPLGITGHQFLIDPQIPYTGHNRGICLAIDWEEPLADLDFVFEFVAASSAEGSDPGVCIAPRNDVPQEVIAWGEAALGQVLDMQAAAALARRAQLNLRPLGGTGQGIIGALASAGLRAGGMHGRFVDMPGLRELGARVTAAQLHEMGIEIEHLQSAGVSHKSPAGSNYLTLGWVRPRLCRGKPVLAVKWSDEHDGWVPVDRKKVHPVDQGGF